MFSRNIFQTIGWHKIEGTPTSIEIGQLELDERVNWIIAVPAKLNLTQLYSGPLNVTGTYDETKITSNGGVEYIVWRQKEDSKKFMLTIKNN